MEVYHNQNNCQFGINVNVTFNFEDGRSETITTLSNDNYIIETIEPTRLYGKTKITQWYNKDNQLHRDTIDGPAIITKVYCGKELTELTLQYYINGIEQRKDDGPTHIHKKQFTKNGEYKEYWMWKKNGFIHRDNGPAIIKHFFIPEQDGLFPYKSIWYQHGVQGIVEIHDLLLTKRAT